MKIYLLIIIQIPILFISCGKKEYEQPEKTIKRKFTSFIFVGMINEKPGLYKYTIADSSYSEFWDSTEEEVVELSYSDNHSSSFFLTAGKTGKEGIFPFIKNAKLYVLPDTSSKPEFVKEIGSGLQVFSRWESEIVFRIVLNSWDKKVSTFINQTTFIYNIYGRALQEETKTYDIIKDGYPRLPKSKPDFLSPSGKYQLTVNGPKSDSIFLFRIPDKENFFITSINKPLNDISWSDDRKFIFISTLDLTPSNQSLYTNNPNTSSLYVYSLDQKKIIREWAGSGFKNFFTINDFLIFDYGFGRISSIYIYNFKENKIIDHISVKNGCGLREIPEVLRPRA